jgi:urea transporter
VSGDGILESLSLVGLLSLCCIGLGGIAGGAALAGGGASATTVATGTTSPRGALVSGLVTAATVLVVGLVVRRRLRRSGNGSNADSDTDDGA